MSQTSALTGIIAESYSVFGAYALKDRLHVCSCGLCMTPVEEQKLRATPLRAVSAGLMRHYLGSVESTCDVGNSRELRYFLPRMMELLAAGEEIHTIPEVSFKKLGQYNYRLDWPADEHALIDRFFAAYLTQQLSQLKIEQLPRCKVAFPSARDTMVMLILGSADLARLLSVWETLPGIAPVAHLAEMRGDVSYEGAHPVFRNAFLSRHGEDARMLGAWLMREGTRARIEASFFETKDPLEQAYLSEALQFYP